MISIFLNRVFRAIKIDIDLYEEVEKDKSATLQAGIVVVLSSLAAGVGALQLGVSNFLLAPALSLLSWYVWAYVIYFVGVKLFGGPKTKSNHGELLRTIGFSSAPGLIRVFGVTPDLMTVTFIGSAFWMLACMVVAVKSALDYAEFTVDTSTAYGALQELYPVGSFGVEDASYELDMNQSGAEVVIERFLGTIFDDVEWNEMNDTAVQRKVLANIIDQLHITVTPR